MTHYAFHPLAGSFTSDGGEVRYTFLLPLTELCPVFDCRLTSIKGKQQKLRHRNFCCKVTKTIR